MPRLPSRLSLHRRRHLLPPRSTSAPPPNVFNLAPPSHDETPPQSWLEIGLSGYSVSFRFQLNNQEIIINLQDPVYLAQIVTEGMQLGMQAYNNHMNYELPYPSNPFYYPRPHIVPSVHGTELPFSHPQQPGMGALLSPSIQSENLFSLVQVPSSDPLSITHNPSSHQPVPPSTHGGQSQDDATPLPSMALQRGIRPQLYVLNSMRSFIVQEEYIKQYILKCPVRLSKCTMDIRIVTNPNTKKVGVFLVPTLVPVNRPVEDDDDEEPSKMTLMIWNCRGSEQSNFSKNYRSMLDYHRPAMVLLLETHMMEQKYLANDFCFTNIANVPAVEHSGGMALVWKNDAVVVDGLSINREEIHCTIKIVNPPAE